MKIKRKCLFRHFPVEKFGILQCFQFLFKKIVLFSRGIFPSFRAPFRHSLKRPYLGEKHLIISLFVTLFLLGLLYRLNLTFQLMNGRGLPSFQSQRYSFIFLLRYLWGELTFSLFFVAIVWFVYLAIHSFKPWFQRFLRPFFLFLLTLSLFLLPVLYGIHRKTMLTLNSGLTFEIFAESLSGFVWRDFFHLTSSRDLLLIFLPALLFWGLLMLPKFLWLWRDLMIFLLIVAVFLLHIFQPERKYPPLNRAITTTPVVFVLQEVIYNYQKKHRVSRRNFSSPQKRLTASKFPSKREKTPSSKSSNPFTKENCQRCRRLCEQRMSPLKGHGQLSAKEPLGGTSEAPKPRVSPLWNFKEHPSDLHPATVRLNGPLFMKSSVIPKKRKIEAAGRWNVIVFVLESVGMRYVLRRTPDGKQDVMPFFKNFIKKGWLFRNHFSPANTSPRSVFSIFSGLYPLPRIWMLSTKRDIYIPSLKNFLPKDYETFLITPAPLRWYFPRWFFFNSGLKEMYGYYSMPIKKRGVGWIVARNEIDVISFFIQRLKRVKEPFWATYLSFIPHYPYTDYGKRYRIAPHNRGGLFRYYNNLHLLDALIKRVVTYLERSGLLKRSILVFVGDHGEAFGQHKGNYTHSRHSYNENYHAPLFFYQPKLFKPRIFNSYTSHVDILPTLLDALKIPYNRQLFQGESLFQKSFQRRQIFLFGNENTLSSIDEHHIKTQISFRYRWCWSYDLDKDPHERQRRACTHLARQKETLLLYHQLQAQILQEYNRACRKKQPFHHLKHPVFRY